MLPIDQLSTEGFEVYLTGVSLGDTAHLDGATVAARAMTLAGALGFVQEFYEGPFLESWYERDGRYVMDVCDWFDLWFTDPPVRGWISAPRGFKPSAFWTTPEPRAVDRLFERQERIR